MGFLALFGILGYVLFQVVGGLVGIIYFTGRFFTRKKREHKEQVMEVEEAYIRFKGRAIRFKARYTYEPGEEHPIYHVTGMNEDHTALTTEEGHEVSAVGYYEIVFESKTR